MRIKDSISIAQTDTVAADSLSLAPTGMEEQNKDKPPVKKTWSWVEDLSVEIVWGVINFLPGSETFAVRAAMPEVWRKCLAKPAWWRSRCAFEYFRGNALPMEATGLRDNWRERYRELSSAQNATAGTWCYRTRSHGLGDRVASPQMFVGPSGQKLFSYGGWYRMQGPQTDLKWASLDTIYNQALYSAPKKPEGSPSSSSAPEPTADGDGEDADDTQQGTEDTADKTEEKAWRFQPAAASGKPVYRAGVQTLTPCWFRGDRPSEEFVQATAAQLGDPAGGVGASLVVAFGGAQGGYRNESCDWAVGVLYEGQGEDPASVFWGQPRPRVAAHAEAATATTATPTRRGAHTATYVPGRLAGTTGEFPQGCMVVFGGHTDDCTRALCSVEILDLATWQWRTEVVLSPGRVPDAKLRRHGHSATLLEFDNTGYLVVVGGGRGSVLSGGRSLLHEDKTDAVVLDTSAWCWTGLVKLGRPIDAPAPGRHHTATLGLGDRILLLGGGDQPGNRILVLHGEVCVRRSLQGENLMELREVIGLSKKLPRARMLHAACCLLPWAPLMVMHGGWDIDVPFLDLWVCALGHTRADLQRFAKPSDLAPWSLESTYQSEATHTSTIWSDEEYDGTEDEDEDDDSDNSIPVRFTGRGGQIRIVHMSPADLMHISRNNNAPPLNMGSRNDMNLMNALALAHPSLSRR